MSPTEIPKEYSTLTEWCEALARQGKNPREIRQETNCSRSTAYNAVKAIEKEQKKGKALKPEVKVEEIKTEGVEIPQLEEPEPPKVEEPEPSTGLEKVGAKLMQGAILDPEDLENLARSVNELFPENLQRPDKSMRLLGKVWFKPANRILQEYLEENIDLYFAGAVTVIVFAPAIYGLLKGKLKPEKEKKKEESS